MGTLRRMRRRRIIGTAAVGGLAYRAGKNAAGQQQGETGDEQAEGLSQGQLDELEKLGSLHEKGVINDEEFATAKKKILG